VVPAQLAAWAAWRLGGRLGLDPASLAWVRFAAFFAVTLLVGWLGIAERLPRTERYLEAPGEAGPDASPESSLDAVEP